VLAAAHEAGVALRRVDADTVGVACSELTTVAHLGSVWAAFGVAADAAALDVRTPDALPPALLRESGFLTHPVFHEHRSETALMRWLRRLADADLALDRTMIPLGSCTMKLNAAAEMEPISWPAFADLHPLAPEADAAGTLELVADLERWLAALTGYAAVSLQPNAGSQGELAGLLAIAAYHRSRGAAHRDVCLIPASAHGTNAASAVMAGMRVVVVATSERGDVDLADLRARVAEHRDALAALMITYPSTHGVYEADVREVCAAVHEAGGQVYVDGANLNALVGLARPGVFGGDVSHLNLHKTFCIPHGGGGPGVGPVAVAAHLAPFLPGAEGVDGVRVGAVSAAPHGSPGVLPISWMYLRMMGVAGLRRATLTAVAAANYVARRLGEHFPVLYTGGDNLSADAEGKGFVAHECILDLRGITKATGVTVDDVAKRLADHGLHAPTMSFPVAGTLMVEPTESEDLAEIDRFVEAMISIRGEIDRVAAGEWPVDDNPLRGAPHTAACLVDKWDHPYSRELAAYPTGGIPGVHDRKVWPPVRRVDGAHGDRNLVCSCPPVSAYAGSDGVGSE
jgi:glycine dehydrogenase